MSTVAGAGTIVTSRDLTVLRTLLITRVLDGAQVMTVAGFRSLRRTNRRLLKLVQAGLLKRWFVGTASGGQKALYGLSPQGANLIGETTQGLIPWKQDALITSSQFLAHQQAVNAVFIRARFEVPPPGLSVKDWTRPKLPLSPSVPLIPDGYFRVVQSGVVHPIFLEVDLGTESSRVWRRKIDLYLKLAIGGEFERLFHEKRFRTVILVPTLRRLDSIRITICKRTEKLFWLSTFDELEREGLWSPIWLRPVGEVKVRIL
jgi:hypothetical protein